VFVDEVLFLAFFVDDDNGKIIESRNFSVQIGPIRQMQRNGYPIAPRLIEETILDVDLRLRHTS
jgi:hypothetical protein